MKKSKRVVAAFAVLCIAAMLLSSSTFAWFSMNENGAATGLEIHVKTSATLKVAQTEGLGTADMPANFLDYSSQVVWDSELLQIEPVSTTDGQHFFLVDSSNIGSRGEYINTTFTEYTQDALNAAYNSTDSVGYADYVLAVYATNSSSTARDIVLSDLKLTYAQSTDADEAFRVAVFVQEANNDAAEEAVRLVSILGSDGSSYFTTTFDYTVDDEAEGTVAGDLWSFAAGDKTIYGDNQSAASVTTWYSDAEGQNDITSSVTLGESSCVEHPYAISSTGLPLGEVESYNNPVTIGSVPAKGLAYYKVTLRLWLEGEDETCNDEVFASLDDVWNLEVGFGLSSGNSEIVDRLERELITYHFEGLAAGDTSTAEYPYDNKTYYAYKATLQGAEVTLYSLDSELTADSRIFQMKDRRMVHVTSYTDVCVGSIELGTSNTTPVSQTLYTEQEVLQGGTITVQKNPATVYEYEIKGLGTVYAFDTVVTAETKFYHSNVENVLVEISGTVRFDPAAE